MSKRDPFKDPRPGDLLFDSATDAPVFVIDVTEHFVFWTSPQRYDAVRARKSEWTEYFSFKKDRVLYAVP